MWWLEWVSEAVVGNNMKIFKTLSPSCPVNNSSLFLRCRTCNHPPNPHDLRGGPGWEGDFLPRADHPGCPLRRPHGSLQTTHSKAQEDPSLFALATQITKSTFSFHHPHCFPHPFSKRCALLRNQIKLCFVLVQSTSWSCCFVLSHRCGRETTAGSPPGIQTHPCLTLASQGIAKG